MTPYKAMNEMKEGGLKLKDVRSRLAKRRVKTTIPTLYRIRDKPDYEPSRKLWDAILIVHAAWKAAK